MLKVSGPSVLAVLLCVFFNFASSVSYRDLEALGINCPDRFQCRGSGDNRPFYLRNCECDSDCQKYQDCCVNVQNRSSSQGNALTNVMCLQYGLDTYSGIYVVSKCSSSWTGSKEVKEKCEGLTYFSAPVIAAPVTSTKGSVTYKNLHCAQCNNADMNSLKILSFRLSCEGLQGMTEEQIMDQIFYKKENSAWGVNRADASGKPEFKSCLILFELPEYLKKSVRYCRANVISTCPRDWTRPQVKRSCEEYTAVVYTRTQAFKNPHCAICNRVTVSQMECYPDSYGRNRLLSFTALIDGRNRLLSLTPQMKRELIDINPKSNNNPTCPSEELYDPFFKRCRKLGCAIKGFVIQNGKCVRGS